MICRFVSFVVNRMWYPSIEHYLMFQKCSMFNDFKSATRALTADTPAKARSAASMVKGFNKDEYRARLDEHIRTAVYERAIQNEEIRKKMLDTGTKQLIHINPYDKLMGVQVGCNLQGSSKLFHVSQKVHSKKVA